MFSLIGLVVYENNANINKDPASQVKVLKKNTNVFYIGNMPGLFQHPVIAVY